MKVVKPLLFVALAAVLIAAPAASQDATAAKDGKFTYTPDPSGEDVTDFLNIITRETPATILLDPSSPQIRGRKIHLLGPVTMDRKDVFNWVRSVLSFQRLVLVPNGPRSTDTWMVLDLNAPQITNRPEYVKSEDLAAWEDRDGVYIVTTITLKHLLDTARVRNAIAQLSTRQIGRINDVPETRSFVIGDFAPVVVAEWRLLQAMDEEAGKIPPAERAKLDPRRKKPAPKSTIEQQIEKYEQRLMGSQTPHAAQYFLSKILELNTRLEKERAEAAATEK